MEQDVASAGKKSSTTWAPSLLSFGKYDLQNVHSAAFLPSSRALVLGLARGDLLVIEGTQAVRSIAAHQPGPQIIADDGSITYSGVRGMALRHGDSVLLTAGV
jgi:echinoderm microtubule-associated protein-like 6